MNLIQATWNNSTKTLPGHLLVHVCTMMPGLVQDNISAFTHLFGCHAEVNSYTYKPVEVCFITWNILQTHIMWCPLSRYNWQHRGRTSAFIL